MPEVRGDDERAHFTGEERDALANEIVALIKGRLTEGQGNHPACMQCVTTVAALAFVRVVEEATQSEHIGEILGVAKLTVSTTEYLLHAKATFTKRATDLALKSPSDLMSMLAILAGVSDA